MKRFAIGVPGARPRVMLETDDPIRAGYQTRGDEVAVETDIFGPVIISADGQSAIIDPDPGPGPDRLREMRTAMLAQCDWTQLADAALSEQQKAAWIAYRTMLRALPENQPGATLETVIWPTPPAESE